MVQILGCGRTVAGEVVAYDIQWEGDLSAYHAVLWAMEICDGDECVVLGHGRTDGAFTEQFVEDVSTGRRESLDEDADLGDGEITVRVPASVVGVAVEWPVWTAVIRADGEELARQVVPQR
jgi:hypothetical protein